MKGTKTRFLPEFSFQICLSRGATFPDFRERRWSDITFFAPLCAFSRPNAERSVQKWWTQRKKLAVFGRKQWAFRPNSTAFFSPSGGRERPLRSSGRKAPVEGQSGGARRRFRAWGCIGEPIYKEGGALFGTETLCISRKALNSQLVKNTFGSACAYR